MKILDRYVISTFLKNYLIAFFVLIGMYVTLDMVFNFDELVQAVLDVMRDLGAEEQQAFFSGCTVRKYRL